MAERTDQRTADVTEVDSSVDAESGRTRLSASSRGRAAAVSFLTTVVGLVVGGALVPLGVLGGLVGVFAAAFALGVGSGRRRYLSLAASGALVTGVAVLADFLVLTVIGIGVPIVAAAAIAGGGVAALGHYLGRDVREGLTRDL